MAFIYGMKRAVSAEHWKAFAGEDKWREGYSAFELAQAWQDAAGFPAPVARVLAGCTALADLRVDHGIIEHATWLDSARAPSMTT